MQIYNLVKRSQEGDNEAFHELINANKLKLYRTAFFYCKNEDDAIDLVSDAVYKAYMKINTLKNPEFFSTWITKILINSAKDFLKKQNRVVLLDEIEKLDELNFEQGQSQGNIEDNIDLHNAVDKLNGKYRDIIILRYFHDFSLGEIAKRLKRPVGTVKSYLNRAIGKLKSELREE